MQFVEDCTAGIDISLTLALVDLGTPVLFDSRDPLPYLTGVLLVLRAVGIAAPLLGAEVYMIQG